MAIRSDVEKVLDELTRRSGIHRGELGRRYHKIKKGCGASPDDPTWIDDATGNVYDDKHGAIDHYIGNVFSHF